MKKLKFFILLAVLVAAAYMAIVYFYREQAQLKVVFVAGKVFLDNEDRPLQLGDVIPPAKSVKLGEDGKCFLQMPGGSIIRLSARASMQFDKKNNSVHLASGKMEYQAASVPTGLQLATVTTPHGDLDISSKIFQLQVTDSKTVVAVHEGEIKVRSEGQEKTVKADHGALLVTEKGAVVSRLPAAPEILAPTRDSGVETISLSVQCRPQPNAAGYQWQYAGEEDFAAVAWEQETRSDKGELRRPDKDGTYFVRVRTINRDGLTSRFSAAVAFDYRMYKKIRRNVDFARNYYLNKDFAKAVDEARAGLAVCPDHVDLLKHLALSLLQMRQSDEALLAARKLKDNLWPEAAKALQQILEEAGKAYPDHPLLKK